MIFIEGYGWQICYCTGCNTHIGWKFTPTNSNLKPEKFWGLTRTAIRYTYNKDLDQEIQTLNTVNDSSTREIIASDLL